MNSFSRNRGNDCFECGERGRHCEDELFFVSGDRRDDQAAVFNFNLHVLSL